MSKKLSVALTGGIGSGKSTVASLFAKRHISIIDADQIARDLLQPDTPQAQSVLAECGDSVRGADGQLERAKLRERVFHDAELKSWLENLLHPVIRQTIQLGIQNATSAYAVIEIPLLAEKASQALYDQILVVDAPDDVRQARAMLRSKLSATEVQNIMQHQASRSARLSIADRVIQNDGSLAHLDDQVEQCHQYYLQLAAKGGKPL